MNHYSTDLANATPSPKAMGSEENEKNKAKTTLRLQKNITDDNE
jgi:hypothetical protein